MRPNSKRQTINAAPETVDQLRVLAELIQTEQRRLKPPSAGETVHIAVLEAIERRQDDSSA